MSTRVAKRKVVLGGAAFVAIPFDGQLVFGITLQDVAQLSGVFLEGLDGVGAELVLVVIEVGVFDSGEQLVDPFTGGGIRNARSGCGCGGLLSRSWSGLGGSAGDGRRGGNCFVVGWRGNGLRHLFLSAARTD